MEELTAAVEPVRHATQALNLGLTQGTLQMLWVGIVIYMIGMLLVGFWCSRRIKGLGDFLVAGRRLPLWMATATLLATWFGAGSSMGVAATVYSGGLGDVIADPFAASLSLIIAGVFVVGLLRRAKCLTVTDIVSRRYGKWAGVYTSLWMVPVYVGWLGAQVMGMGIILQILTGMDKLYGTLIAAAVVLTYTMVGGMWAVTMTDVIQVSLIVLGLLVIVPGAVHQAGGWNEVFARVPAAELSLAPGPEVTGLTDLVYYCGSWIVMGLGCVVGQDVIQRALSSRNDQIAVSSSIMAGFFYAAIALVPITIGFAARIVFARHGVELSGDLENQVLPNMAILILGQLHPIILVLFLSALISAIMSSADSSLLAGSSLLVNNVISPLFPRLNDSRLLGITRITTLLLTIIAMFLALKVDSIYRLMINSWASQLVIIFIPVITALYVPKASKSCAWAAMAVATVFWLTYVFFDAAGIELTLGSLVESGMTVRELVNSGIDWTPYLTGPLPAGDTLLSDLAAAGTFQLDAASEVLLTSGQTPFRLLLNSDPFDRALTCGAVYGFVAGLLAFLFAYLGERIPHWIEFWGHFFAGVRRALGVPPEAGE